ncbi:hypothetical protein D3C76_1539540 [compost metagenome]
MEPQFELDDAHANYAVGLQSGMRISLINTGGGDVANADVQGLRPGQLKSDLELNK